MNKPVSVLISAACLVIIACGSWWAYDKYQKQQEIVRFQETVKEAKNQQRINECRDRVSSYKTYEGKRDLEIRYGAEIAESLVNICKMTLEIEDAISKN